MTIVTTPRVWPKVGASVSGLAGALRDVLNKANNVPKAHEAPLRSYLDWSITSAAALHSWLETTDIDRLIRTSTFWASVGLSATAEGVDRLVYEEMTARQRDLQQTVDSVERAARQFTGYGPTPVYAVPDTNVLMAFGKNGLIYDWHAILAQHVRSMTPVRVVVPLLVVDELEKIKSGTNKDRRAKAQDVLKLLQQLFGGGVEHRPTLIEGTPDRGQVTVEMLMESAHHVRLPRADDELVDVVARLNSFTDDRTVLVTFDFGADLRAAFHGVDHVHLGSGRQDQELS